MTLFEIAALPGVRDLPIRVKFYFVKALMAEEEGRMVEARGLLARAIGNEMKVTPIGDIFDAAKKGRS